jgi:hypothetical protein
MITAAPGSTETSVFPSATRRNIPEDIILHSHRRENLNSDILITLLCKIKCFKQNLRRQAEYSKGDLGLKDGSFINDNTGDDVEEYCCSSDLIRITRMKPFQCLYKKLTVIMGSKSAARI